jgi:hypothetical protein
MAGTLSAESGVENWLPQLAPLTMGWCPDAKPKRSMKPALWAARAVAMTALRNLRDRPELRTMIK